MIRLTPSASSKAEILLNWVENHFNTIEKWNEAYQNEQITVFRGVELSKKGEVMQCPTCHHWMPYSSKRVKCTHCARDLPKKPNNPVKIIFPSHNSSKNGHSPPNERPFLSSFPENSTLLSPDSFIQLNFSGIQYKNLDYYDRPRIVVRQLLHNRRICAAQLAPRILNSQSVYNIVLPQLLEPYAQDLVEILRSNILAAYFYLRFSQGKRLFSRILIKKLRTLPFIPRTLVEEASPHNQLNIKPIWGKLPDEIAEIARLMGQGSYSGK
jgi:hypothetical protein